jgi:hypothetical protein
MTACKETERSLNRVLAGLVIVVTVVMGAMTHMLASIQPLA